MSDLNIIDLNSYLGAQNYPFDILADLTSIKKYNLL